MKKKTAAILFTIFAFFLALGITLYPVISTAYNERHQSQIHTAYQELVDKTDHEAIAAEKAKAENGEAPKSNNDDEIIIDDNDNK